MKTKFALARYPGVDLECGHPEIWGGVVTTPQGKHAVPLNCAICTTREEALDLLRSFALYNALVWDGAEGNREAPLVMKAS